MAGRSTTKTRQGCRNNKNRTTIDITIDSSKHSVQPRVEGGVGRGVHDQTTLTTGGTIVRYVNHGRNDSMIYICYATYLPNVPLHTAFSFRFKREHTHTVKQPFLLLLALRRVTGEGAGAEER